MTNENGKGNAGPEKRFRAGSVSVTIWANEREVNGNTVTIKSASISRNYKDKNGDWQRTNILGVNDIQRALIVLAQAQEYLLCGETDSDNSNTASGNEIRNEVAKEEVVA